jgi:hypothetical protein
MSQGQDGGEIIPLVLSTNRKYAHRAWEYCAKPGTEWRKPGTYYDTYEKNSFGLPAILSCPGSTDYCRSVCYAQYLEYKAVSTVLNQNNESLLQAGNVEGMAKLIRDAVAVHRQTADKLSIPQNERRFRIHWSGDFFSAEYATAWRNVIQENPDIQFFAYTRSFVEGCNVLPVLTGLENLELFLSVDKYNVDVATKAIDSAPDARVSYLVDYLEEVDGLRAIMSRAAGYRAYACPENMRKPDGERILPLISERGGACSVCRYCTKKADKIGALRDVVFVKTGQRLDPQPKLPFDELVRLEKRRRKSAQIAARAAVTAIAEELTIPLFEI